MGDAAEVVGRGFVAVFWVVNASQQIQVGMGHGSAIVWVLDDDAAETADSRFVIVHSDNPAPPYPPHAHAQSNLLLGLQPNLACCNPTLPALPAATRPCLLCLLQPNLAYCNPTLRTARRSQQ